MKILFEYFYLFITFSFTPPEDILNKAVLEAKKWFQEKTAGSSSVAELGRRTFDVSPAAVDHVSLDLNYSNLCPISVGMLYYLLPHIF